jgi:hypothetical protein
MDWQNNRLYIGVGLLVVLGGLAVYLTRANTGDRTTGGGEQPTLPTITDTDVHVLDITRPAPSGEGEPEHVRLELHDGHWRVTQPLDAVAAEDAAHQAVDRLAHIHEDVTGVASRNAEHHEELEVDEAHAVHVRALGDGDAVLMDLFIGAFRGGSTMVRVDGNDTVVSVHGSMRHLFARDLKDWRDRTMLDLEPAQVHVAEWVGPHGTFRFERPETPAEPPPPPPEGEEAPPPPAPTTHYGDWAPVTISYVPAAPADDAGVPPPTAPVTTLEHFASSRVTSVISGLAHMHASDFAAASVDRAAAGLDDTAARVTLTVHTDDGDETHTVRVGGEASSGSYYAMRDDDPTIFVIPSTLQTKVSPEASSFEQAPAAATPTPSEGDDMPALPGGGGGELPPELRQQLEQMMRQQGGMH